MDWFKILIITEIIVAIICLIVSIAINYTLLFQLCALIICLINLCGIIRN